VAEYVILPDDRQRLSQAMRHMADDLRCDLILTTGGTGFSQRDVTPEATLDVVDRMTPGLTEAMRAKSLEITPRAMLSRAVAGIRGQTLIVNLPGSPKGVRENLNVILPALPHGIRILKGTEGECAVEER
jgi:molybdenum cofactor synthesis domain-containing protein